MKRLLGAMLVLAVLLVTPGPPIAAADQDTTAAIQQVIQRSNEEQSLALAAGDASLMADMVTSDHLKELAQANQDLLANGVTGIQLVKLEWGAIAVAVDGATATATTYETWTNTMANGTLVTPPPARNVYGLVLDNGAWKIKTNGYPDQAAP